jgi:hypothetical protein
MSDLFKNEKRDCAVIAMARTLRMPYGIAHAACKQFGRKDHTGMEIDGFFKAIQATGARIVGFNLGKTFESITTDQKKMTVKQMAAAFADRQGQNFIAMTNNHVIGIRDGEVEEHEVKHHARKRVQIVCEIMGPKRAARILKSMDRWGETYRESDHLMPHHVYWEAI